MRIVLFTAVIFTFSLMFLYGCNSKGYEIEEVEDYTDTSNAIAKTEIKQDLGHQNPEIKDTLTLPRKISITYTIQIGAFSIESNVIAFTSKSKTELPYDISYRLIQGLYKVRFGNYTNKDEAFSDLSKVIDAGYDDAFIIEIRR